MKQVESIESLAKKYQEIFWETQTPTPNCLTVRYMTNFLIEFAGAVEHHLSSERAVEADACCEHPNLSWNPKHTKWICIYCGTKGSA